MNYMLDRVDPSAQARAAAGAERAKLERRLGRRHTSCHPACTLFTNKHGPIHLKYRGINHFGDLQLRGSCVLQLIFGSCKVCPEYVRIKGKVKFSLQVGSERRIKGKHDDEEE